MGYLRMIVNIGIGYRVFYAAFKGRRVHLPPLRLTRGVLVNTYKADSRRWARCSVHLRKATREDSMIKLISVCIAPALLAVLSSPLAAQTTYQGPASQGLGTYSPNGNQNYGPKGAQQQTNGIPGNGIPTYGTPTYGTPAYGNPTNGIPTNGVQNQGQNGQPSTIAPNGNQAYGTNGTTFSPYGNTTNGNNGTAPQTYGNQTSIRDQNGQTRTCQTFGNQTSCN